MADGENELANLPVEILYNVFRQTDPVGLIAASQTCKHFRSIIQPSRKHFAERLLALEIEPEYGGPGFTYFAREGKLEPDWNETVWERMRWACSSCVRLLPHRAFDNHSILRLKNRKPTPGSQAAKLFCGVTSWEPVEKRALTAKAERRQRVMVTEEKQKEKLLRKQYHFATTKTLNDAGSRYNDQSRTSFLIASELPEALELSVEQLNALTEAQEHTLLDRAAHRIEKLRAGWHRHLRKCNECRFQVGQFKQGPFIRHTNPHARRNGGSMCAFNNNKGTPEVPIVRSRRIKFATPFDRYFPGIGPYMSAPRPSLVIPLWRVYRKDTTYMISTLYMARCPACAIWQELRAFRWSPRGWGYGEFIGAGGWMTEAEIAEHSRGVNRMRCNKCLHQNFGYAELAQQLSAFMKARLERECRAVLELLSGSWHLLKYPPINPQCSIKQLLASLEAAEKRFPRINICEDSRWIEDQIDVDADNMEDHLAVMNWRRLEWLQASMNEQDLANACVEKSDLFGIWQDRWEEATEYWRWTRAWIEEVEQKPEQVVWWALEG